MNGDFDRALGYLTNMYISDRRLPERPSLEIHPDVLLQRPVLASYFGPIVATWADIEGRLEAIFLLCTADSTALAELEKIKGWDARSKFFVNHVRTHQADTVAIEIRAILKTVAQPARKRHEVAHGIWAICKELPQDLVIASPAIYTVTAGQAIRAEAKGSARFLIDKYATFDQARVVTEQHLDALLNELRQARSLLHTFMIEKMPAIVKVHQREALPRAVDHPDVAARIRNAEISNRKRRDAQR